MADVHDTSAEEWRSIPCYPDHEASSFGRIRSSVNRDDRFSGKMISQSKNNQTGYLQVRIKRSDGNRSTSRVHTLVCLAFHGEKPTPKHTVAHNDGNKMNCAASNLRWATLRENHADKIKHGTLLQGSRVGGSKLTEADVLEIRALWDKGDLRQWEIGKMFGIHQVHVGKICMGQRWKHIC